MSKQKKIFSGLFLVLTLVVLYFWGTNDFEVKNSPNNSTTSFAWKKRSAIAGKKCKNKQRRPFAVMLSGNDRVRPLAAIDSADLVFELPVTRGGINRMMAVYQCESPEEIGSVRSARSDFIPLAMGLDSIYAHWGGSHFALEELNQGVMDNIDALSNRYRAFYRRDQYTRPDDGFTSVERLKTSAEKYNYRLDNQFEGFAHISPKKVEGGNKKKELVLGYPGQYKVSWSYNPKGNEFARSRGRRPEIDKLTGKQVTTKNLVVVKATKNHRQGQYINVHLEGTKDAFFFRSGKRFEGKWKKPKASRDAPPEFLLDSGEEFQFLPGSIWVQVIGPQKQISWN